MTRELGLEASDNAGERVDWVERFLDVRRASLSLCDPLVTEDFGIQPMDDASPPKGAFIPHIGILYETVCLQPQRDRVFPTDLIRYRNISRYYIGKKER